MMNERNTLLSYDSYLKKRRKKISTFLFLFLILLIVFCVFKYNSFTKKIKKYEYDLEKYNATSDITEH